MSDNEVHSAQEPVEQLAEDFLSRYRAGERPTISDYAAKYPNLAEQIQELFPALIVMEANRPPAGSGPLFSRYLDVTRIPEQLGEYRLLREIGRGGMGVVYEAIQESLSRHVALKILPFNTLINPTHLERFRREARAAARLHHTHIVPVYGVGEHEGYHFYAMQFIHGQGLDAVLQEVKRLCGWVNAPAASEALVHGLAASVLSGKFSKEPSSTTVRNPPPVPLASLSQQPHAPDLPGQSRSEITSQSETQYFRTVAGIGVQVAEALEYAHRQGIVHRDIKPSNLLLDTAGQIWVTDFGLAKADGSEELTSPGDLVGTLRYLAPERLQGKAGPLSDIYGLGITLYEMLTLRPAFGDSDRAMLLEHIRCQEPPALQKVDPRIPRDLETIVLKAIAKEPDRRYATAEALADDLRRFVADRPIQARRTSLRERAWRWCRRNPLVAGLLSSVVLLVLMTAIGSTVGVFWLHAERNQALANLDRAEKAERERTQELYNSYLAQARAIRLTRLQGQRLQALEAIQRVLDLVGPERLSVQQIRDLRNEAIACLALPDLRPGKKWDAWTPGTTALAFDGSYRLYARGNGRGNVSVRNVEDDKETNIISFPGSVSSLLFSPSGRYLAASGSEQYCVWDLQGQPQPPVVLQRNSIPVSWIFSQDNRQIALAWRNGAISVQNLTTGRETIHLETGRITASRMAWSPDGRKLVLGNWPEAMDVQIWDLPSGKLWRKFSVGRVGVHGLAWHPGGKFLALGLSSPANRAEIWDTATGERLAVMEGHGGEVNQVTIHPGGDLLATGSWDGTTRLWDLWTGRTLLTWPGSIAPLQFSLDGRLLGCQRLGNNLRSMLQLVEVAFPADYRTLVCRNSKGSYYQHAAISPDGNSLAVATDDGVYLVALHGGGEQHFLALGRTYSLCFQSAAGSTNDRSGGYGLWTSGPGGLRRWPFRRASNEKAGAERARLGPPRTFHLGPFGYPSKVHGSADGRALAVAFHERPVSGSANRQLAIILNLDSHTIQTKLSPHPNMDHVVLSPDGQWAVSGGWHPTNVRIWNARTGWLEKELSLTAPTRAFFTPDRQHLVISQAGEFSFWKVGSWQCDGKIALQKASLPGWAAFSPDRRVIALELTPGEISLLDLSTREILAKLADPHLDPTSWLGFSPDGGQLVSVSAFPGVIHVWELGGLRRKLANLGLDKGLPRFSLSKSSSVTSSPCASIAVDLGDLPWELPAFRPDQRGSKVGLYTLLLALNPWNYQPYFQRGRILLQMGQIQKAMEDFQTAWLLRPPVHQRQAAILVGRAEAFRRLRNHAAAIADLRQALALGPEMPRDVLAPLADALLERGWAFGDSGQWQSAAADYAEAFRHHVTESLPAWFEHATLRMAAGDQAGYRRICRQLLERFRNSTDADEIAFLAHTCVLGPDALTDKALILKLTQRRFDMTSAPSPHHTWSVHVLGLGYYRAGQYQKAVGQLHSWFEANQGWQEEVLNRLVLGMAYQKLGNEMQARRCLVQADAFIRENAERAAAAGKSVPPGWRWRDWLAVYILRNEFEILRKTSAR
jgi:serine/threonine protein kinase/WD40 repeat protein